jgi:outer membrane protein assembly factor BamB
MPARSRYAPAALVALALLVAACSDKGPVREPADLKDIEAPALKPRVVWDKAPGEGSGDVQSRLRLAVEADLVITADIEGDVYALDPHDGHRLWESATGLRLVSGPTVSGDLVLLGTLDAQVIALKRADGTQVWVADVSSEVLAPPVAGGKTIVVRCGDGKLFGLSADDGRRIWSFDRAQPQLTLRGQSAPLVYGGTVFVGLDNGHAVALRTDTGETLWEQVVSAPAGRTELERIVDVDADLLITREGVYALSFGGDLAAVSLEDGRVAWRRPVKSYTGVALAGANLVITDEDGLVWALDVESGASVWKQEDLKYRKLSPPVTVGEYVVVADFEGYLHWLSPQDGRIVARKHAVGDPVTAPLVVQEDLLYVLDVEGEVAAVRTDGG